MENELTEYTKCFELHLKAQQDEMKSKLEVRSTYYSLMRAKENLRSKEKELLEEVERN